MKFYFDPNNFGGKDSVKMDSPLNELSIDSKITYFGHRS
jgi:hypothetical protein